MSIPYKNYSRAAATLVFAGATFLLLRAHGILHWRVLSRHFREIPETVRSELFPVMNGLVVIAHCLAIASVFWCMVLAH
jgi:hypothetical protein